MSVASFVPTDRQVIVVPINQVPDLTYLRVEKRTGQVDLAGHVRSLHPNDREPIEAALRIKDTTGAYVLVLAVDHKEAQDGVREALAMGADAGALIVSQAVEHSDALAKANLFAQAVRILPRADLVLVGTETMDPDWSLIGGALSGILGWSLVPGGRAMRVEAGRLHGLAMFGAQSLTIDTALPAVATVRPGSHGPRWPTSWAVRDAYREKPIHTWNLVDMEVDGRLLARMASLTETRTQRVVRQRERTAERFTDPPEQSARVIGKRLARKGYLGGF